MNATATPAGVATNLVGAWVLESRKPEGQAAKTERTGKVKHLPDRVRVAPGRGKIWL